MTDTLQEKVTRLGETITRDRLFDKLAFTVGLNKFKIGPIEGTAELRRDVLDGFNIHLKMTTFDRDSRGIGSLYMNVAVPHVVQMAYLAGDVDSQHMTLLARFVEQMFREMWMHEFDEGYLFGGQRIRDPHALKGVRAETVIVDEALDA